MHLILDTNGLILKKRRNSFFLTTKKETKTISPVRVSSITVSADCMLSASAVSLAVDHEIPVFYMNNTGKVFAKLYAKKFVSNEILRIRQTFFQWTPAAITWIKSMLILKTEEQIRLIGNTGIYQDMPQFEEKQLALLIHLSEISNDAVFLDIQNIMNIEAQLGANYWKAYFSLFPREWKTGARTVRPAGDPVNACINYFYGFNYGLVEHAIYLAGLNPYQGLMHQNQYNKPVLSYDLIEPFRPFTDRFVWQLFNNGVVNNQYFDVKGDSYFLNRKAKKALIPMFFDYLDKTIMFDGEKASYRNHIYRYAQKLRKIIETLDLDDLVDKL